jgi:NADH/NAD ratio-sensing transcriptional regulator Rex
MGEVSVTSQDIALVNDWQGRDILAPMLARKKVELEILMVSSFTHPDLVQRMVEEGVKGVFREVNQLMLFRLVVGL